MKTDKILIIGACGQIGTELTAALRLRYGKANVLAADLNPPCAGLVNDIELDVLNHQRLEMVIRKCGITQIYLLAAMLSATGGESPDLPGS